MERTPVPTAEGFGFNGPFALVQPEQGRSPLSPPRLTMAPFYDNPFPLVG
jgi:hypothetical protein